MTRIKKLPSFSARTVFAPAGSRHSIHILPVSALRPGMFVTELDRPWLGTPFPLQGILIHHQSQIDLLSSLCATVTVDLRFSVCDCCEALLNDSKPVQLSFTEVARQVKNGEVRQPGKEPAVHHGTQGSALEEEILYAHAFFTELRETMQYLGETLQQDDPLDLKPIEGLLCKLTASVRRNSDAILWLNRLHRVDGYTYTHALDVSVHLMVFANFLSLPQKDVERLGMIGLMQDIGKVLLPPDLLCKKESLTDEEYALMRSHVDASLTILARLPETDRLVFETVERHHERIDGSGYPSQLKGDVIDLYAELAGFVDTYCAIIRQRPYAPPLSTRKAIAELVKLRGSKFRETVVDQFIQCMGIYPIGSLVELNTGEVGVVIQQNITRRLSPRVLIILDTDKRLEKRPRSIDLLMEPLVPTGEDCYRIAHSLPEDAYGINPMDFYLA